jgi:hypothetical protein
VVSDNVALWRRLDQPGHEAVRLVHHAPFWQLSGTAVFGSDDAPCRLEYLVVCDDTWRTRHAQVLGWIGARRVRVDLAVSPGGEWRVGGIIRPEVAGCVDLDLAFSPATNTLPIRRLNLSPGQEADVRAAWLRFPELTLAPLPQTYRRIGERGYRYTADSGAFVADLDVDSAGLVVRYSGLWQREPVG